MKLTIGWWRARDGSKWHVDWVGDRLAVGHISSGLSVGKWSDAGFVGAADSPYDLLAPWTEPKLRPWKREEVPLGAWIRNKRDHKLMMAAMAIGNNGISLSDMGLHHFIHEFKLLCDAYEHSIDGGKTWHPCGVVEEQQ